MIPEYDVCMYDTSGMLNSYAKFQETPSGIFRVSAFLVNSLYKEINK